MSPLRRLSATLLYLCLTYPSSSLAQETGEPLSEPLSEPLHRPSATLLFGSQIELGAVLAPERSTSARARIPWRPRERHGLFPARVMASMEAQRGPWVARSQARLYAHPLWLGSPQAPSFQDPLGTDMGFNELSLSYQTRVGEALDVQMRLGRWTPDAEHAPRPWSLEASERLWSRAPDPRDRTVTGASLDLRPQAGLASSPWIPRSLSLSTFVPSVGLKPQPEERRLGLRGRSVWRYAHLSELRLSGGQVRGGARWARLSYALSTEMPKRAQGPVQRAGFSYTGSLLYRAGPSAPLPYVEAIESSIGGYGEGLVATHSLIKELGRTSLALGYEWRDPQLDFAYNAQHTLSIRCHVIVYTQLSVSLEQRHLWSARDDRLSFGSSLTFAQLSWSPTWAL